MIINLLICDDNLEYTKILYDYLTEFNCEVSVFSKENMAFEELSDVNYDLIIVERFGNGIDGVRFVKFIRGKGSTIPIIVHSEDALKSDIIEALRAGADDYIAKPTDPAVIYERILAILRGRKWAATKSDNIELGNITVSLSTFRVWKDGNPVELANLEMKLLAALMQNEGGILTREQIASLIWEGSKMPESNVIDQYIRRIRVKLQNSDGSSPIKTIRGMGYKFQV